MACFIMTGQIMGGEKYGGISPKSSIFPGQNLAVSKKTDHYMDWSTYYMDRCI